MKPEQTDHQPLELGNGLEASKKEAVNSFSTSVRVQAFENTTNSGGITEPQPQPIASEAAVLASSGLIFSEEQETFLAAALDKSIKGVVLLGKAGVGKTTVVLELFRRADDLGVSYLRCAPTGVAAIKIGGETVHRIINLVKKSKGIVDMIVVDETSMLRADLLDELDTALQHQMLSNDPFGGIKMILIGDPGQLPPVVVEKAEKEYLTTNYHSSHFFASYCFSRLSWHIVELTKIFRQKDDRLPKMLNLMRSGEKIPEICAFINKHRITAQPRGVILCPTNKAAAQINDVEMRKLAGEHQSFMATIEGEIDAKDIPTEQVLNLKIDAKVMIVKNIYRATGRRDEYGRPEYRLELINGDVGTIVDMEQDGEDSWLEFRCDRTGVDHVVYRTDGLWTKERSIFDPKTKKIHREVVGSFVQLPIRVAWAITIHKSQGATIEEMTIDLRTRLFDAGQAYVAFSRCTSLEKLWVLGRLRPTDIMISPQVTDFLSNKLSSQYVGMKAGSIFDVPELGSGEAEEKKQKEKESFDEMLGD